MHVTLFANGEFSLNKIDLLPDSTIVAADGGAHHCKSLGITPDIIIGDLDSISDEDILYFERLGTTFHKYPSSKDETDLELALIHIKTIGATEITIYGLLGGRWDMSFSNLTLLASSNYDQINFYVVTASSMIRVLRGGMRLTIHRSQGGRVSIIPLCSQALGITTNGLEWSLDNEDLEFGSQLGLSNCMKRTKAQISLKSGTLLIIIDKEDSNSSEYISAEYSTLE